ncbi:unnamed protein product [Umbelopsis ramanniana]
MAANSREKLYTTSKGYGFTPALQRTRKPFQARNLLTLGALLTFVGGVCVTSVVDDKK